MDADLQALGIPVLFKSQISEHGLATIKKVKHFVETECLPRDEIYLKEVEAKIPAKRWEAIPSVMEEVKAKAQKLGLWNLFLCKNSNNGALYNKLSPGFTNVEYGIMAKYMGKSHIASEACNCSAPDTGDMELLIHFGNEQQNEKFLKPLLEGKSRSAFAMTDKNVASSNALNICLPAVKEGNEFVVTGEKWFISGAGDPRCDVWFLLVQTSYNPSTPYKNHSILVIDVKKVMKEQPNNVEVTRHMPLFGFDDAPHGHMEIKFDKLRIPIERNNILGEIGEGFKMIQARLGPGRIHHCMRTLGIAEESLRYAIYRGNNRMITKNTKLSDIESFRVDLVKFQMELECLTFLVLNASFAIDTKGSKGAKKEIAYAKILVPRKVCELIDWAMQQFGAVGMANDFPLSRYYVLTRLLRYADGPDEVHLKQLVKHESKKFGAVDEYFKAIESIKEKL